MTLLLMVLLTDLAAINQANYDKYQTAEWSYVLTRREYITEESENAKLQQYYRAYDNVTAKSTDPFEVDEREKRREQEVAEWLQDWRDKADRTVRVVQTYDRSLGLLKIETRRIDGGFIYAQICTRDFMIIQDGAGATITKSAWPAGVEVSQYLATIPHELLTAEPAPELVNGVIAISDKFRICVRQDLFVTSLVVFDGNDHPTYERLYTDFRMVGEIPVPHVAVIKKYDPVDHRLRKVDTYVLESININYPSNSAKFRIPPTLRKTGGQDDDLWELYKQAIGE